MEADVLRSARTSREKLILRCKRGPVPAPSSPDGGSGWSNPKMWALTCTFALRHSEAVVNQEPSRFEYHRGLGSLIQWSLTYQWCCERDFLKFIKCISAATVLTFQRFVFLFFFYYGLEKTKAKNEHKWLNDDRQPACSPVPPGGAHNKDVRVSRRVYPVI